MMRFWKTDNLHVESDMKIRILYNLKNSKFTRWRSDLISSSLSHNTTHMFPVDSMRYINSCSPASLWLYLFLLYRFQTGNHLLFSFHILYTCNFIVSMDVYSYIFFLHFLTSLVVFRSIQPFACSLCISTAARKGPVTKSTDMVMLVIWPFTMLPKKINGGINMSSWIETATIERYV